MKKPLKQAIQENIDSISLDEQQLDALMQMQHAHGMSKQRPSNSHFTANKPWYVAIAAMVMVFVLGTVVVMQYFQTASSDLLVQEIAHEVARNHLEMKPMEVQTAAINDVQNYFTKLDFLPQPSTLIDSNNKILLAGGRYCSIQGSTAAQLRYKDKQGGYVTLFETHHSPELLKQLPNIEAGEEPLVTYAKGIKVKLWQERGLLMVSTEKPE